MALASPADDDEDVGGKKPVTGLPTEARHGRLEEAAREGGTEIIGLVGCDMVAPGLIRYDRRCRPGAGHPCED
jgi:hypothetical protein